MLPTKVIRNGNIVEIKTPNTNQDNKNNANVNIQANNHKPTVSVVNTKAANDLNSTGKLINFSINENQEIDDTICTLRIKYQPTMQTLLLKMFVSETIQDVKNYIYQHFNLKNANSSDSEIESKTIELIQPFPRKIFQTCQATLKQENLFPNASLIARFSKINNRK